APPPEPFADPLSAAPFYRAVFARVRADFPEIYDAGAELLLDGKSLLHALHSLDFPLLDARSDPAGDAFEAFAGSDSRARRGRFSPPCRRMPLVGKGGGANPGHAWPAPPSRRRRLPAFRRPPSPRRGLRRGRARARRVDPLRGREGPLPPKARPPARLAAERR